MSAWRTVRVVPAEPTSEMIHAAVHCLDGVNVKKAAKAEGMTTPHQVRCYKARQRYLAMVKAAPPQPPIASLDEPYQARVAAFMIECFGRKVAADTVERNHRFLEEALELVQALGCTASEAHQLVDYVFGRPIGNSHQETGGVLVTLAALCTAAAVDMTQAGEDELQRVGTKIEAIREKQKRKPRFSPLPGSGA